MVRGDHTQRKTASQDAALFLAEENQRQRRLLKTQGEQVEHVSQRALSARRDADMAAEKKKAMEEKETAQRAAADAKSASWAHHRDVVQKILVARVATESM